MLANRNSLMYALRVSKYSDLPSPMLVENSDNFLLFTEA